MGESGHLFRGVVRAGVIVPDAGLTLPEGTVVQFQVEPLPFTPEEQAEFDGWERIGDEAWAMIDEWEKEDGHEAR